jgi:glycosyltransferase involved in cell wall biosynthesis
MVKVLGLTLYGVQAASTRHRMAQYVPNLKEEGIDLKIVPLLGEEYIKTTFGGERYSAKALVRDYIGRLVCLVKQGRYDLAIVHVELFPLLPGVIESRLLRIPYIYDFDDAFFLKYRQWRFRRVSFLLKDKFAPVLSHARAVLAGNHYLADYAKQLNPATTFLPTVVDTDRYVHLPSERDDIFTVGWIGSPSTSVYLRALASPLAQLGREGPVRFVVVGGRCEAIDGVEVVNLPWEEATEVSLINTFDVGVMPLFDDEWARGKCALKLIQYMACGVPAVASPVGANLEVINNSCGLLASGSDAWLDGLRRLKNDGVLRRGMGVAARQRIEHFYSLRTALPVMSNTIKTVAANRIMPQHFSR